MDKEALVRAYDAMQSKDGTRRDVSSALTITSQERLYVIQVRCRSDGLRGFPLVATPCVERSRASAPANYVMGDVEITGAERAGPPEGRAIASKLA